MEQVLGSGERLHSPCDYPHAWRLSLSGSFPGDILSSTFQPSYVALVFVPFGQFEVPSRNEPENTNCEMLESLHLNTWSDTVKTDIVHYKDEWQNLYCLNFFVLFLFRMTLNRKQKTITNWGRDRQRKKSYYVPLMAFLSCFLNKKICFFFFFFCTSPQIM